MSIKQIEEQIQLLPNDQMERLKRNMHFQTASLLYGLLSAHFKMEPLLLQMSENMVMQSFDEFMSQEESRH